MSVTLDVETESSTETQTRYIEAKLSDSMKVKKLRDKLYAQFIESDRYWKVHPHITIIPPFSVPKENISQMHQKLSKINTDKIDITVTGLSVWPNIVNPRVVLLNIDAANIQKVREEVCSIITTYGGEIHSEPVDPHVTLFKTNNGYSVSDASKDHLQHLISEHRLQWSTKVQYLDLTTCN